MANPVRVSLFSRISDGFARPIAALAIVLIASLLIPSLLHASTIIVNTLSDSSISGDGLCSLREAINNANSPGTDTTGGDCVTASGNDTIVFSVSGTILLSSSLPGIDDITVTIDGSGETVTVDGAGLYQIWSVQYSPGGVLNLSNITIADGYYSGDGGGAEIGFGNTLNITNCNFLDNSAGFFGGAIQNWGTLTIVNSSFVGNSANSDPGGAISNGGPMTVINSNFLDNTSQGDILHGAGGGIFNAGPGPITIADSTFSGNSAASGGGIFNEGALILVNSTLSGNSATQAGGAIFSNYLDGYLSTLSVINSTISDNSAPSGQGSGIYNLAGASAGVSNSILSSNSGGNCSGAISNGGYNISSDATCGFGSNRGANGDTVGDNVDPLLDPNGLQNNGGSTETIALQSDSPAIDEIPIGDCPATDQRGFARPDPEDGANGPCDIGAFESGSSPELVATISPPGLDFGNVAVRDSSLLVKGVVLTNAAAKSFSVSGTKLGQDFKVAGTTCSSVLVPAQSCTYWLSFHPRSKGTKNETFQVSGSGSNTKRKVKLHGVGTR